MSLGHFAEAYKLYERKSAKDVSVLMYVFFTLGSYVWLAYGIANKDLPIILSFSIAVVGTTVVSSQIYWYGKHPRK